MLARQVIALVGDLVLTCTGALSRNRRVGIELGKGRKLAEVLAETPMVAEGVNTTKATYQLSRRLGIEMPITAGVYAMLYGDKQPRETAFELMDRPLKRES
jgi:glycerol-3-phosphate dehydrogenase (NAD(P)+)